MLSEASKSKYFSKQNKSWIIFCDWAMEVMWYTYCYILLVNIERQAHPDLRVEDVDPLFWWEDYQCHYKKGL